MDIVVSDDSSDRLSAVTTADVDIDGLRDLVVRSSYGGAALIDEPVSLTVIRASDAPFRDRERLDYVSSTQIGAGGSIRALGDWDGDGHNDLGAGFAGLVLLAGPELQESDAECRDGAGIGDVDGDGIDDSACRRRVGDDAETSLWIHASSMEPGGVDLGLRVSHVLGAAGDVDGDGHGDVLVRTAPSEGMGVIVLSGADLDGEPLFTIPSGSYVALGDVNADGFDDLVLSRPDERRILWGAADGPRQAADALKGGLARPAGDANCDGFADLLVHTESGIDMRPGGSDGAATEPAWTYGGGGRLLPLFD